METVKYQCKKCGFSEKPKFKDYFFWFSISFFVSLGIIFLVILTFLYITSEGELIEYVGNKKISLDLTVYATKHSNELRDIAINLSGNCSSGLSHCYAKEIYKSLLVLRYVPSSKYKPFDNLNYTLQNGGDCKQMAMLFTALMHSIGFDSEVVCSRKERHCISKVPLKYVWDDDYVEYIVIDISKNMFEVLNKSQDVWEYDD